MSSVAIHDIAASAKIEEGIHGILPSAPRGLEDLHSSREDRIRDSRAAQSRAPSIEHLDDVTVIYSSSSSVNCAHVDRLVLDPVRSRDLVTVPETCRCCQTVRGISTLCEVYATPEDTSVPTESIFPLSLVGKSAQEARRYSSFPSIDRSALRTTLSGL